MASMHISLPNSLKEWAESRITEGQYDTASDYIRDLLRRDQARLSAMLELKRLVAEGIASGPGRFETIDAIKTEARRRHAEQAHPK
jgi:antitoxin ParD1/3/4